MDRRDFIRHAGASLLLASPVVSVGCGARGEFPTDRVEILVGFPPGGGTDQTARLLADAAEATLDTSLFVTNREGNVGAVSFEEVRDAPDGHTVGLGTVGLATLDHLGITDLRPDDVTGIIMFNSDAAAVTVRADSPYQSIHDLLEAAPDEDLQVSTDGDGGIWHLAGAGLAREAGVEFAYVPYDGGAPAITALLGGEVDVTTVSAAEVLSQEESGDVRCLAVMGSEPLEQLPDVPTLVEEGIDWTLGAWRGVIASADIPDDERDALETGFTEAFESEDFQEQMSEAGFVLEYKDSQEFNAFMRDEYKRFEGLYQELGLG